MLRVLTRKARGRIAMGRIVAVLVAAIALCGSAFEGHAQLPPWGPWKTRPTITVVSGENDSRLPLVDKAVDFWNGQFIRMGSAFRLGPISHTIGDLPAHELHARFRSPSTQSTQERFDLVESLRSISGDILVVMTDSTGRSFATMLPPPGRKVVVAIRRVQGATISDALNWIAHELGHAIGLGHNNEDGALMCGHSFCQTGRPRDRIQPLGDTEIVRLLAWYPRNWTPYYPVRYP